MVSMRESTLLAVVGLASIANAQIMPSAIISSNLTAECTSGLTAALGRILVPCNLGSLLTATTGSSTDIVNTLLADGKFLDGFCSTTCNDQLATFSQANCGDSPILGTNYNAGPLAGANLAQLRATVSWARGAACVKDGSNFCAVQQFAQFKQDFPSVTPNVTAVLSDKKLVCTTCVQGQLAAISANQTGVPTKVVEQATAAVAQVKSAQSSCSSFTGNSTTNSNDASSLVGSSFGLLSAVWIVSSYFL